MDQWILQYKLIKKEIQKSYVVDIEKSLAGIKRTIRKNHVVALQNYVDNADLQRHLYYQNTFRSLNLIRNKVRNFNYSQIDQLAPIIQQYKSLRAQQYDGLIQQQKHLEEQRENCSYLKIYEQEISQKHIEQRKEINTQQICSIEEIDKQISKLGKNLGWSKSQHQDFLSLLPVSDQFFQKCANLLSKSLQDIYCHYQKFRKKLELEDRKKYLLQIYKKEKSVYQSKMKQLNRNIQMLQKQQKDRNYEYERLKKKGKVQEYKKNKLKSCQKSSKYKSNLPIIQQKVRKEGSLQKLQQNKVNKKISQKKKREEFKMNGKPPLK